MALTSLRAVAFLALGLLVHLPAPPSAALPTAEVSVVGRAGADPLLSVSARAVPLRVLLSEIAGRAGFQVVEVLPPAERDVSLAFEQLPLERALRKLLAGESFVFVYGPAEAPHGSRLVRLLLLGPDGRAPATTPATALATSPAVSPLPDDELPPAILPEDADTLDPDGPLEKLVLLAGHRDPRTRVAALEALATRGTEDRARRALMSHLTDEDPRVRSAVVGLLGPFAGQWPGAEDTLWTALRDVVPGVRHLALLALWESKGSRAEEAVRLALQDADPGVRALAEEYAKVAVADATLGPGRDSDVLPEGAIPASE